MDLDQASPAADWSMVRRIAFRFAFAYWLLYILPYPIGTIPGTDAIAKGFRGVVEPNVSWVAEHVLRFSEPVVAVTNGSGDTSFHYVRLLCVFVLAAVAALVWTLLDRKSRAYPRLYDALRVYVRFALATGLWIYGMDKVIQLQFPEPSPDRLLQTYGSSSPMGLLWTFMGASTAYTAFAGSMEVLGGLLLLFRRTTTLGALVSAGVMTNVVALNFCYDVPVKIFSSHLLLMSIFLLLPDLGRLFDLFISNRATSPRSFAPPAAPRWFVLTRRIAWLAFCAHLSVGTISEALEAKKQRSWKPAIFGRFAVTEFVRNGTIPPPLLTDTSQWNLATFTTSGMVLRYIDRSVEFFYVDTNPIARTMTFTDTSEEEKSYTLRFTRTAKREISLEGTWVGGESLKVLLNPLPEETVLTGRGFHWVNEYPFSR